MRKIIGLCGYKGSGKDTTGKIIQNEIGNCISLSFADPVKKITSIIFSVPYELLEGKDEYSRMWRDEIHPYWSQYIPNITPRKMLTMMGSDIIRKYVLDNIWVLSIKKEIDDNPDKNIVITDVRFEIEEQMIRSYSDTCDVKLIDIVKDIPEWEYIAKDTLLNNGDVENEMAIQGVHISEWSKILLKPDYTIDNNKTLSCLRKKIIDIL